MSWEDPRRKANWAEIVLKDLEENGELMNGNPTVKGLRRFIKTHPDFRVVKMKPVPFAVHASPGAYVRDSLRGATVSFELDIITPDGVREEYGGLADAYPDNLGVDSKFAQYPGAMADTRSEGRAIVRALGLKVTTADEIMAGDSAPNDILNEPITGIQWDKFNNLFKQFDISAAKFFKAHAKGITISKMTKEQALNLFEKLDEVRKDPGQLADMLGYNVSWRDKVNK